MPSPDFDVAESLRLAAACSAFFANSGEEFRRYRECGSVLLCDFHEPACDIDGVASRSDVLVRFVAKPRHHDGPKVPAKTNASHPTRQRGLVDPCADVFE